MDSVRVEGSEVKNNNLSFPRMKYTRPLALSDVDNFQRAPDQRVTWAMSSVPPNTDDGTLGLEFHDRGYGTATLNFSPEPGVDGLVRSSVSGVDESKHSKRHDTLITLHG